jgi:bacteriophage N4 adsorption protein B
MESIHHFFVILTYIAAFGFLIFGLDDLFFDLQFSRYLFKNRHQPHIPAEDLSAVPEQWIAIFVPAWREGGVVNKMADYAAKILLYEKYDIFIGVYPNDPETMACVDEVTKLYPRIHKVVVPHAGPTSKADCLNWIYRAMCLRETPGTREYGVIALHDAEDILHPLTLKIYNFFVPKRLDMAQIPVFPLELNPWKYWVGNTYIDEFCELRNKDMYARESLGGIVPSAGVGTAFCRDALETLASEQQGNPFRLGNLTEDYEIGIRLKRDGYRTAFVNYPIDRTIRKKNKDGSFGASKIVTEVVCVRENFPRKLTAAVRQRSRWILGIAFQTWEQVGWKGTLPMRYTLLRDRRAPLTHVINAAGYLVVLYVVFNYLVSLTRWAPRYYMGPLFGMDSLIWKIVMVDTCLLFYRAAQKIFCVNRVFGPKQAIFSVPRTVVANLVNLWATLRAIRMYLRSRFSGKQLEWLKTEHLFPTQVELSEFLRTIEDLIVERGFLSREEINKALQSGKQGSTPFHLLRLGLLDEKQFTELWAEHSGFPVKLVNPYTIPVDLLKCLPEAEAFESEIIPVQREGNRIIVAFREPPTSSQLERLTPKFGLQVKPVLCRPSNITFARIRAYPRLILPPPPHNFFSDRLGESVAINESTFLEAITKQHETRLSLADVLVNMGVVTSKVAAEAWAKSLGCPSCSLADAGVDVETYSNIGRTFCWLHRLVPIEGGKIATAASPHPNMVKWLTAKLGKPPEFVADLPRNVELSSRVVALSEDSDQVLIDRLVRKGVLTQDNLLTLASMRLLVTDPPAVLLSSLNFATEKQLNDAFIECFPLPQAVNWTPAEVSRLTTLLPRGFAVDTGCFALHESKGMLTFGLSRLPSARELVEIHERFTGYPIFFQALTYSDAEAIRQAVGVAASASRVEPVAIS